MSVDGRRHVVVLTGAGTSAESGLQVFRGNDGVWEKYRIEDVATPQAWRRDAALVLEFYNLRRKRLLAARPNAAHVALAALEVEHDVSIVTQNVDDLHERAGSTKVLHLHGELRKSRSTADERLVYDIEGWALNLGDVCERGSQLRPHVVWFGEDVPMMYDAARIVREADALLVVGTSLEVYPAAGLVDVAPHHVPKYLVDPDPPGIVHHSGLTVVTEPASTGVPKAINLLRGVDWADPYH